MIEEKIIFDSFADNMALWCQADLDAGELARATEVVMSQNLPIVSVSPVAVPIIWPWLENCDVKILARFYLDGKNITESQVSDVTVRINEVLKRGAHGAQVFLDVEAVADLVEQTYVIRDDLFFNKDLVLGLDILNVGPFDWDELYANLRKINASAVMFVFTNDMGDGSMFVAQIYAMLNMWNLENKFDLHFAFGPNFMRIEQVLRMIKTMRPELISRVKVFTNF